jgi:aminoglycoside phosphotransferase (APT) family kinase protein
LPTRRGAGTLRTVTAPPAEGSRIAWSSVPWPVREEIGRVCGSPVVEARTQPGGFSPGVAARVRCDDGSRWFVKAASGDLNPDAPRFHRQEAAVLADLEPQIAAGRLPVPRLHGTAEVGPWFALVIEDITGQQPELPWREEQLRLVISAVDRLAVPAPAAVRAIADGLADTFSGWRTLAASPPDSRLDPWSRTHLTELAALEETWPAHAAGDVLLHCDIRADNLLMTSDGIMVVDWPHACRGAAFVEMVLFAPSVAMQGGPEPAELLRRSRVAAGADPAAVRVLVCALAGFFTARSLEPPVPGIPGLRAFQAAQGEVARRWLAALL